MPPKDRSPFFSLIGQLLRPVVSLGLRKGLRMQDFTRLVRNLLLESAANDLSARGISPSASRLSVMTGLRRPEAAQFLSEFSEGTHLYEPAAENPYTLITKVLGLWQYDKRFASRPGIARPLGTEGLKSDFARLVRSVSRDLSHHTVLFELERLKLAHHTDGVAHLDFATLENRTSEEAGYQMLAEDLSSLVRAVDENISAPTREPHLHSRTVYDNVPASLVPAVRRVLLSLGRDVHARARKLLARFDADLTTGLPEGEKKATVSFLTVGVVAETTPPRGRVARKRGSHETK